MHILLSLILGLSSTAAATPPRSMFMACVNALTGAGRYAPLDVRGWKGLDASPYAGLITPQWEEWDEDLQIEGALPKGLHGRYVRMGPVGFDSRAGERKRSMIDSAGGLLREYDFGADRPTVRVRQVQTESFRAQTKAGRFLYPSISTFVRGRWNHFGRMQNQASVAAYPRAGNYVVTDEMQRPVELLNHDLSTTGEVTLDLEATGAKYLAHAKRDPVSGNWCHFEFAIGKNMVGRVICLDEFGAVVWRSAKFQIPSLGRVGQSPYIHDWGFTKDSIVLYLQPYLFDAWGFIKAALGVRPDDGRRCTPSRSSIRRSRLSRARMDRSRPSSTRANRR